MVFIFFPSFFLILMDSYTYELKSPSGYDQVSGFNTCLSDGKLVSGFLRDGSGPTLVLDSEKCELVKAPSKGVKKNVSEEKVIAALKSHSEAERRRRQRINAHLGTLRGLVPCNDKMDKATLLAEVIKEVKELKKNAIEASKVLLIPMDTDEVTVEPSDYPAGDGTFSIKASLCCEYRPELLSDLKQALDSLHLKILKAEISTLEGRLKNVFIFTATDRKEGFDNDSNARGVLLSSVHQALSSVLTKASISPEYSASTMSKRRKVSFFDSSSSSS